MNTQPKRIDTKIKEYGEGSPVTIGYAEEGRLCIFAETEGGYNGTTVDLLDVVNWVKENRPEFIKEDHA